jgi:hypothetical protein
VLHAPRQVGGNVACDREEPRPRRSRGRVVAVASSPGPQEGVLHDLLGEAGIVQRPNGEAVDARAVGLVRLPHVPVGLQPERRLLR